MINHRESFLKCIEMEVCINRPIITLRGANSRLKWRKNIFRISLCLYESLRAYVSICPSLHKTYVGNCYQRCFIGTGRLWRRLKTYTQSLRFSLIPISGAFPWASALQPDGGTRFPMSRTRAPLNEALLGSCPFSFKKKKKKSRGLGWWARRTGA